MKHLISTVSAAAFFAFPPFAQDGYDALDRAFAAAVAAEDANAIAALYTENAVSRPLGSEIANGGGRH